MKGVENCWEFKKCGREPGGAMAGELGVCPVTIATFANGLNRGTNGGRICWAINGSFDKHAGRCIRCDFFNLLEQEEAEDRIPLNNLSRGASDSVNL
jgi:hypothetical protein